MKILIVDDSATARLVAKKTLEMIGIEGQLEFREAGHGGEALQVLEEGIVDLIICDINMPVMSGFTFIRNIQLNKTLGAIPIIFVTSVANDARSQNLLVMGAKAVISKPLKLPILKKVCETLGFIKKQEEKDAGWGQ